MGGYIRPTEGPRNRLASGGNGPRAGPTGRFPRDYAGGGTRTRMPPRGHLVLSQARITSFATPAASG